ncbi:unnamed protein product [Pleuronectes platessa]|uniref:Uncharacterized protein n=1 Tax=Pleuronectes platessa TaxID=8262 RepID=A0A9N7UHI2_PLEPL|nr:unnamed protein product [Pleuronectes platessa]
MTQFAEQWPDDLTLVSRYLVSVLSLIQDPPGWLAGDVEPSRKKEVLIACLQSAVRGEREQLAQWVHRSDHRLNSSLPLFTSSPFTRAHNVLVVCIGEDLMNLKSQPRSVHPRPSRTDVSSPRCRSNRAFPLAGAVPEQGSVQGQGGGGGGGGGGGRLD